MLINVLQQRCVSMCLIIVHVHVCGSNLYLCYGCIVYMYSAGSVCVPWLPVVCRRCAQCWVWLRLLWAAWREKSGSSAFRGLRSGESHCTCEETRARYKAYTSINNAGIERRRCGAWSLKESRVCPLGVFLETWINKVKDEMVWASSAECGITVS